MEIGETAIASFPPLPALRGSCAELSVTSCTQGELFRTLDRLSREHGVSIQHDPATLPAALRPCINGAFETLAFVNAFRETLVPVAAPARLGGAA